VCDNRSNYYHFIPTAYQALYSLALIRVTILQGRYNYHRFYTRKWKLRVTGPRMTQPEPELGFKHKPTWLQNPYSSHSVMLPFLINFCLPPVIHIGRLRKNHLLRKGRLGRKGVCCCFLINYLSHRLMLIRPWTLQPKPMYKPL